MIIYPHDGDEENRIAIDDDGAIEAILDGTTYRDAESLQQRMKALQAEQQAIQHALVMQKQARRQAERSSSAEGA